MKSKLSILFCCFQLAVSVYAQKRNNQWILGGTHYRNCYKLDFNSGFPDTSTLNAMGFYDFNTSICDTSGQILFYSNGVEIANRDHDTLSNSQGFNPGTLTTNNNDGLSITQGGLFLPKPNSISEYYLFHESEEFFNYNSTNVYRPISLSYSIIDVALDSGKGGIENNFKNIHLIDDTLTHGKLSAVRHANGRDWWLIIHRFNSNLFYKFIITPYTILGPFTQNIGSFNPADVYFGQTKFSEDGNHYFIQLQNDSVDLFDFDRCSGLLSNPVHLYVRDSISTSILAIVGGAFSPSGRFLYLNNDRKIHQFDLWASNIQSSDSIVAVWDSTGTPSIFYESTLAPDGRIYLCTYVGTTILHYIEYPDSLGTACSIIQNSFVTPNPNTFCFPNYANYELGADIGSICDTLLYISLNEIQAAEKEKLNIFYHPAWQTAFINASGIQGKNYSLSIFDITGKQLFYEQGKISSQYFTKDLHCNFANGIYIVSFSTDREKLISRFIIQ